MGWQRIALFLTVFFAWQIANTTAEGVDPRAGDPFAREARRHGRSRFDGTPGHNPPIAGTEHPSHHASGHAYAPPVPPPSSGGDESSPSDGLKNTDEEISADEESQEDGPQRWSFFNTYMPGLADHDIEAGGWLDQSYTANFLNPADRSNGSLGVNDRANDYQLNQFCFHAQLVPETDTGRFSLGWRTDLMYGSDARWVQSTGFDDTWTFGKYPALAMPQLFGELFIPWGNGATITLGRFWSPIGYEGVPAVDRFFFSATNTFMFAEPSTHTGMMAKYPLNDQWTVQAGIVRGWDISRDDGGRAFLGTAAWKGNDDRTTLTFVTYYGSESGAADDRLYCQSNILTHKFSDKLTYVLWSDFGNARGLAVDALGNPKNGQWFSLVNAAFYAIDEKRSVGLRFEWFRDDDGTRITEWLNETPLGIGDVMAITAGMNWTPRPNWVIRPEIRCDWANGVKPFDAQTSSTQWTAATDVIFRF